MLIGMRLRAWFCLGVAVLGSSAVWPAPAASDHGPAGCSVTGELDILTFTSAVFDNTRKLRVWLPPGYHDPAQKDRRYPVLYLNDGQDVFNACTAVMGDSEWQADETATRLIGSGRMGPLIIVGIDNAGKHERPREYLPFPDKWLKPPMPNVQGKKYPRFLVDEVMPFINARYRTDPSPASTGLGGSSYGAGIALYTVMERPERFGRLLLESPSIYAHDDYLIHRAEHFDGWPLRIFIGVGTENEPTEDVDRLEKVLRKSGLGPERLLVVRQQGAGHDAKAWARRLSRALEFLYGRADGHGPVTASAY